MTTDSYELPPIPHYEGIRRESSTSLVGYFDVNKYPQYTAEQMRHYALLAVKAERERAARICEHLAENGYKGLKHPTATECAAAIRGA